MNLPRPKNTIFHYFSAIDARGLLHGGWITRYVHSSSAYVYGTRALSRVYAFWVDMCAAWRHLLTNLREGILYTGQAGLSMGFGSHNTSTSSTGYVVCFFLDFFRSIYALKFTNAFMYTVAKRTRREVAAMYN